MVIVNKLRIPIRQMTEIENSIAKEEKNKADLEYVAMMTDVDIDEEESEKMEGVENE